MRDLLKEFDLVIRMLHENRIRYATVGRLAVAVYGQQLEQIRVTYLVN
ncbi:MAG: hypothetical protein NTZ78_09015 [Candidatus Aureabacteria bacterium]|nr:hypothetical protein [Candidatus Auribacterota bacterium]